jgi:hypothetical protein
MRLPRLNPQPHRACSRRQAFKSTAAALMHHLKTTQLLTMRRRDMGNRRGIQTNVPLRACGTLGLRLARNPSRPTADDDNAALDE